MRLPLRALGLSNSRDKKKKSRQRRSTRKVHVETLEVRQLMTIAPSIAAVTVDHTSLYQGESLTLTASGVQDSDGSVTGVSIYRDTNGNQTLDSNDQSLGQATDQGSGNWTFQVNTSALLGAQTFFATASDNDQLVSDPVAASTSVLNHAPGLASSGLSFAQARDLSDASNLGVKVADMTGGVSDPDPAAVRGVAIVAANTAHGTYQYRLTDAGTWTNVGSVSSTSALLLSADATTRIRFVPSGGFVGSVADAITIRAWDRTSGTAATKVDVSTSGGTTAFSSATDQVGFSVTPIIGDQLQIRGSSYDQTGQAVASDRQGNFVAVWSGTGSSASGLFFQRFSAGGAALSTVQHVTGAGAIVSNPAIGMAANGSFVLAWQIPGQNDHVIAMAQRFDATGSAVASALQLDTSGSVYYNLSVAVGGDGGFAVSWQTVRDGWWPLGIWVRRFAPDGSSIGNAFRVDADNWAWAPSISMAEDDSFVVAWYAYNWHGPGVGAFYPEGIKARRYDSQGVAQGSQFNVSAIGTAEFPSVSMNASGGFTVAWSTADPNNHSATFVRSYDNQGQPLSDPIVVDNSSTRQQRSQTMVGTGDSGEYLVTWTADLGTTIGIRAQAFLANGSPLADPFWLESRDVLSLSGSAGLRAPLVAPTRHGGFLALWSEFNSTNTSTGIAGRRLQLESAPVATASVSTLYVSKDTASSSVDISSYFSDADATFGDTLSYSLVSGNDSLAQLSLSGSALTLVYSGQTGARQVIVRATDSSNRSTDAVLPISIYDPANDAPVLAQRPHALFMPRDLTDANNQGLLVADLLAGVSDLDPAALRGIAVTAVNTANGTYQYRLSDNSAWTDVGAVSGTSSLLLKADGTTRVRFVAAAGFVGSVADAITFRGWDQTTGSAGTKVSTSTNGGTTAFSTASDQLAFSITPLVGSQITVDAGGYLQEAHAVASDKQGNFVTVWSGNGTADGGLFFQRYSASGAALGSQQSVVVAGTSAFSPAIGMSPDGDFVIAWQGLDQAGQPIVLARQYSASGAAKGAAAQIAGGGNYYYSLAAGMSSDGSFVLSWQTFTPWWQPLGIQVQRFAADGSPIGNSFRADGDNWAWAPSVGMAEDGSFAVAWQASNWYGPGVGAFYPEGIMARRFDSQGIAQGTQIHVSGIGTAGSPSLSMNSSGAFAISWSTYDSLNHPVLSTRSYNASGVPLSDSVVVDDAPTIWPFKYSTIAIDDLGEYMVTWAATEANHEGIRAHWYSPSGQSLADQFWVASADATASIGQGLLHNAQIAASPGGSFVIVWDKRNSDDGSSTGVFAQRLQLNHAPIAARPPVTYIAKNSAPSTIDVATSTYFTELDEQFGDHLTYSISSSNPAFVTATITADGQLTLAVAAGVTGATQVAVRAQDGAGRFAQLVLRLSIYDPAGDAPTLVHSPLAQVQPRDLSDAANLGIRVADLMAGVSDLDPGALHGIAIVGTNTTLGVYQYRLSDGSPWTNAGSVSTTSALLLSAEGTARLRLVPVGGALGSVANGITFRAWDQTTGVSGATADTTTSGGASAFSTATDLVDFSVTPIIGSIVPISSGTSQRGQQAVASDAAGNFVAITGDDVTGAYSMQRFSRAGVPMGSPQTLTAAGSGAWGPVIAMAADGHFVATWQASSPNGLALWARRFNADATPAAAAFQVAVDPSAYDLAPSVSMAGDGKFVITWLKYWGNGIPLFAWGQRYAADGQAQGDTFVQTSPAWMFRPAVAMADDGSFVLSWYGFNWDWTAQGTFLQRYNSLGQTVGGLSLVNSDSVAPQISGNAAGQFVVSWSAPYNGHTAVWARPYNAVAQPLSDAILVDGDLEAANPVGVAVGMVASGDFLVTWTGMENGQQGLSAHWYSPSGVSRGNPFVIATADSSLTLHNVAGGLFNPHLAVAPAGSLVATWATHLTDGTTSGVSAKLLQFNEGPTVQTLIPSVSIEAGGMPTVIDLADYFADADLPFGDQLTYAITANDNPSLLTAAITSSRLVLTSGGTAGTVHLTVSATDTAGQTISAQVQATVLASPPKTSGITDLTVSAGASPVVDLWAAFEDPKDADANLLFSIVGDTNQSVFASSPSINNTTGKLLLPTANVGSSLMTVRATNTRGEYTDTSFSVSVGAIVQGTSAPQIDTLNLANDDGSSATDKISTDPTLSGTIKNLTDLAYRTVEFATGTSADRSIGSALTDAGGSFSFTPVGVSTGSVTIYARVMSSDSTGTPQFGPWSNLSFTLLAGTSPTLPQVSTLGLVDSNGQAISSLSTSIPRIAGQVSGDGNLQNVNVQIDENNDGVSDAVVTTSASGGFVYYPSTNLAYGHVTIRARTVDDASGVGYWSSLTFTYAADPSSPAALAQAAIDQQHAAVLAKIGSIADMQNARTLNSLTNQRNQASSQYHTTNDTANATHDAAATAAESAYNATVTSADATYQSAVATAHTQFLADIAAAGGDASAYPTDSFTWPDSPSLDATLIGGPARPQSGTFGPAALTAPSFTGAAISWTTVAGYSAAVALADDVFAQAKTDASSQLAAAKTAAESAFNADSSTYSTQEAAARVTAINAKSSALGQSNPVDVDAAIVAKANELASAAAARISDIGDLANPAAGTANAVKTARINASNATYDSEYAAASAVYQAHLNDGAQHTQQQLAAFLLEFNTAIAAATHKGDLEEASAIEQFNNRVAEDDRAYGIRADAAEYLLTTVLAGRDQWNRDKPVIAEGDLQRAYAAASKLTAEHLADSQHTKDLALAAAEKQFEIASASAVATHEHALATAKRNAAQELHGQAAATIASSTASWSDVSAAHWNAYQADVATHAADHAKALADAQLALQTAEANDQQTEANSNADSQKGLSLTKATAVYTDLAAQADAAQAFQVNNSAAQKVYDLAEAANYRDQLDTVARAKETRDKTTAVDTRIQKVAEADADQPFQLDPWNPDVIHIHKAALALSGFNFRKSELDSQDAFQRAETKAKQDYETSTHAAEVTLTKAETALAKTAEVSRATANANYQRTIANAEDDQQQAEAAAAAVLVGKPSGAPGDAAAEKTSANAEALADKTQTIADAVSQQSYDAGLMAAYVGRLSSWNQAQATPWSGYVLASAQAQQQQLVDSDTAAEQQSVALATADAQSAGSNNDANLAFELGQAGQDETAEDAILDADKLRAASVRDAQITWATDRATAQTAYENSVVEANQKLKDAESQQAKTLQDSLNKAALDYSYTQNQTNYQVDPDVAAVTQSQYTQLIAAASLKLAADSQAAELVRVDALAAARVVWTGEMGAAQVVEATSFGSADKALADAQHDADVQFAQSQAGATAAQQRGGASLSKTLDDASAAADRAWAKDVALAGKDYSQLFAGDDAAFALLQAQNQDAYNLAADSAYKTALVSWSAGLSGQNALLAGYLVNVATDALARDNELAPVWEQLTQASSAADVARANSVAAADKTLADGEADFNYTYAMASDTASSTQAGELADADQLQSVAIATAAANRARAGAYAEAAYNVKTAQAEAAYANTAASDGALWETIAEAKHRASQWTSADDLLFARADEARDNADNAAEVVRVQALGLAAVERTQSLGDADVAQVTAVQDAKLASTRSAAMAANHLDTSQKDAAHTLTNSETAAETTHDHAIAVTDKTWTHDSDAADAIYASASADADTHYGDAQAADQASYQVASANAAANSIVDQTSFSAVYAHAKAGWFLGLNTPSTPGGLSPYVAYSHAISLADKADSLAVSAAEATYDDTISDDDVAYSDSSSGAAALRQTNDAAAENAFGVSEATLQALREIATVQAERTLAIQVAGAKRDFTIASAKADVTQAVADSRAEADRKNALDAAATAYDRAVLETPGLPYGQIYTAATSAAWSQYNAATTLSGRIHSVALGDAGLELVTRQADANVIDTTQLAQADADLLKDEASAKKDLNIALADDAKTEASTDAASQLLRDQLDAAASKLASTIENAAGAVQSHALALATTGLWTAEAAQQVTTDSAVVTAADSATATFAPLAHYLSNRANAMASWTTDLVSHYLTYTDSQSARDSTESSNDATAQETNSDSWSAQEASATQQTSTAQDTHDRAVAAADSAFAQALAPLTVAYQTALANAQRAFIVGQATAQRALDMGGTQATLNAAVLSLKQVLLTAQQSAAADFSSAEFPFEKVDQTAWMNADEQLVLEVDRIDSERQTAEAEAINANFDANVLDRKNRATGQAVLDLSYTLWKASGLESTLTDLAVAHSSPWATEQKAVAIAAHVRTTAVATAISTKQTAIATADEVQQLSSNNAKTTLDEKSVAANHYALDRAAITALEQWMVEANANDSAAQRGNYNARLPRSSPAQLVITPETLNVPRVLSTNQPTKDGYVGNKTSDMYAAGGNNSNFQLSQFIEPKLQERSDTQSRVSSDAGAPWIPSGNAHAVRPAGREYTPQSQAILDSLGGPNATIMDWALVRALVRNGTAKEEYWRPSGDEGKTKVLVPLRRNDGSVDTLVLGSVWAFWWWNDNYFEKLDLRVGSTPAQESIRTTQENQANHNGVMAVRGALANAVLGIASSPVLTQTALGAGLSWLASTTPIRVALITFGGSNGLMEAKDGYDSEQHGDRVAAFQHYEKAFWSSVLAISAAWPQPTVNENAPPLRGKPSPNGPRTQTQEPIQDSRGAPHNFEPPARIPSAVSRKQNTLELNIGGAGEAPIGENVVQVNINPKDLIRIGGTGPKIVADGTRLPFSDSSFRRVQGNHIPYDVSVAPGVVKEALRVVEPGGTAIFSSAGGNMGTLMTEAGFVDVIPLGLAPRRMYEGRLIGPAIQYRGTKPVN